MQTDTEVESDIAKGALGRRRDEPQFFTNKSNRVRSKILRRFVISSSKESKESLKSLTPPSLEEVSRKLSMISLS